MALSPSRTRMIFHPSLPAPSLLHDLATEYPEISGPRVAQLLDQAYLAASALGEDGAQRRVGVFARDRLDVVRERTVAAGRATTRPASRRADDLP